MLYFLKLIRIYNLLMVAAIMYLMRLCVMRPMLAINGFELQFSELYFFFLVFATVLITAAGYVINDYFDRKTDMVNHPETVIVGKHIDRRLAIILHTVFNVVGVALGMFISYKIGLYQIGFIFVIVTGLLWYYSTTYKRQFLIGNIIVALLTAAVPVLVPVYEIPMLNKEYSELLIENNFSFNYLFFWACGFAFFAFFATLAREIIKDIEDLEGDDAYGRNTVPIVLGITTAKVIVISLIAILVAALVYIYFTFLDDNISLIYFSAALVTPLLLLAYLVIRANNKMKYHFASTITKLIMISGLLYSFVIYYTFTFVMQ